MDLEHLIRSKAKKNTQISQGVKKKIMHLVLNASELLTPEGESASQEISKSKSPGKNL